MICCSKTAGAQNTGDEMCIRDSARAILGAPTAALQLEAAQQVISDQLSVRQTEALVKNLQKEKKEKPKLAPDLSPVSYTHLLRRLIGQV